MKKITFTLFLLISFGLTEAGRVQDDLSHIQSLYKTDKDAAFEAALELKEEYEWRNNRYGLMKVHLMLGYIQRKKGVLDEAIKHYLEAIWHGETAPERYTKDLIGLYMNCGVIYRTSGHYPLAIEYYGKGIDLAKRTGNKKEFVELGYNLSHVHRDTEAYRESIQVLQQVLSISETGSKRYFDILNRLGVSYRQSEQYDLSVSVLERLISEVPQENHKVRGQAFHSLAATYDHMGNPHNAVITFEKAIKEKSEAGIDNPRLFSSYYGIGEVSDGLGKLEQALDYYSKAESLMDSQPLDPEYFDLYKAQYLLFERLDDPQKNSEYKGKYIAKLEEHNASIKKVKETTNSFNLMVVTEQFHTRVANEERRAQIWFWSGFTGAVFLFMAGMFIHYSIRMKRKVTDTRRRVGLAIGAMSELGKTI